MILNLVFIISTRDIISTMNICINFITIVIIIVAIFPMTMMKMLNTWCPPVLLQPSMEEPGVAVRETPSSCSQIIRRPRGCRWPREPDNQEVQGVRRIRNSGGSGGLGKQVLDI